MIHILIEGRTLCGKPGVPVEWGDGDRWVSWEARAEATCDECLSAAWKRHVADRVPIVDRVVDVFARSVARREQGDESREPPDDRINPEQLALRGLFANEGKALLRALFAWRGQGSITRWKTKPSRVLAHLADRLMREYPGATAEAQKQGNADAIESVLIADSQRRTAKGHARELARLRDELGSLGLLVNELAEYAADAADDEPRQPATSGAPGHTLCDYEGCDQEPTVTLGRGAVMCEHHAAVALLAGMTHEDARSTIAFARPADEAKRT